ncbi:MAG: hypothetical protein MI741_24490 [Rhodospirillales bacterium]|nr:hypothetical protein [Rhodospirillales bacterium]
MNYKTWGIRIMLGRGAYRVAEAAAYTRTPYSTAYAWFRGRSKSENPPVFCSDLPKVDGDFAVSFLDMVDLLVVTRFRKAGVSLRTIRRAYENLRDKLNTEHPFSHDSLYTDGRGVIIREADELGDPTFNDVVSRQMFFSELHECLEHIEYGEVSKLAARWRIMHGVIINPQVGFGMPVVEDTGVSTFVLSRHYWANNSNEQIVADLFGVSEADVANAVRFEEQYGGRRAA